MAEFEKVADLLPEEEHITTSALRIAQWLDAEGNAQITFDTEGEETLATWIGMLEITKHALVEYFCTPDEEE